ncbi:uncharacterized protein OCT59_029245 [Rhizophagus irregularis]|uniref:uncharacterized protein n=1 Tax=Rhizophagus irregularis TaxID=588596 RepID=UPI00331E4609|nr:hypothetical protein OCT59_029245 [Rhizophagus irregularis]
MSEWNFEGFWFSSFRMSGWNFEGFWLSELHFEEYQSAGLQFGQIHSFDLANPTIGKSASIWIPEFRREISSNLDTGILQVKFRFLKLFDET